MPLTDKDREHEKAIAQAESKDEIFRLIRTKMIGTNRELLHSDELKRGVSKSKSGIKLGSINP